MIHKPRKKTPNKQLTAKYDTSIRLLPAYSNYCRMVNNSNIFFRFTAADCVLGYNLWWASVMQGGELMENHPVAQTYFKRLAERDAFKLTFT